MQLERLKLGEKEIILLGTAHVSQESVDDVRAAIEQEKPDIVGIELDPNRMRQLREENRWKNTDIGKIISSGQTYLFLLTILLSNMQKSLGSRLGVKPGMEMISAIEIAEQKKLPIMLLDRDVNVTLKRAMGKMSIMEKLRFAKSIIEGMFADEKEAISAQLVEDLKKQDVLNELMKKLSKELPSVKSVLVDERDAYIAHSIFSSPGKKILAVVGAGHIGGVKSLIGKTSAAQIQSISRVEKGRDYLKVVGYAIPVIFLALLVGIFFTKGAALTFTALVYWILITGIFSAAGALLAGAHPFAIVAAFVAAPVTTLHPLLAAGWVAGWVEMKMRSPKVVDFDNLRNLNSLGDFASNRVTKTLLVVALTNLGATIGVVFGFPLVASLLG